MYRYVNAALIAALTGLTISALIYSINWAHCVGYRPKSDCEPALAQAGTEWRNLGMTALALATNIIKEKTAP